MKIEILKDVIENFDDKENTILFFLEDREKLNGYNFEEKDYYINDYIISVKKNNLKISQKGKILSIDDNKLSVKINDKYIYIDPTEYYIFIKKRKYNNKKQYFIELVKNI